MTGMIAAEAKISDVNPFLMICLGCILGIPLFIMLFYTLLCFGVESMILLVAMLGVGAAFLFGKLSLKAGIGPVVITIFVYVGMRVAQQPQIY
jgi:hypothetical protein